MTRRNTLAIIVALVVLIAAPAALLADKGEKGDVKGTVSSINSSNINVKTEQGNKNVAITDKTKYTKGDSGAVLADVQPGMAVVVRVAEDGSALEIRLVPVDTPKQ